MQITRDLHLPRFSLEKYVSDYCNIKTNTGEEKRHEAQCTFHHLVVCLCCKEGLASQG